MNINSNLDLNKVALDNLLRNNKKVSIYGFGFHEIREVSIILNEIGIEKSILFYKERIKKNEEKIKNYLETMSIKKILLKNINSKVAEKEAENEIMDLNIKCLIQERQEDKNSFIIKKLTKNPNYFNI
ncbi:MAG TPA: hypothetical protein VIK86_04305 [Candidatus Paceibacterota bacterium]